MTTRRLLLFGTTKLSDMLEKGNVWYVRHYEEYFDEVYVIYLLGGPKRELSQGDTHLVSLSRGPSWLDLALAPIRLWRTARRLKPTSYLTADIVFGWWISLLIRMFSRARIVLMPVSLPEEIYKSTGASTSGLPIPVERFFLKLSFLSAHRILISENGDAQRDWILGDRIAARKIEVVTATVEEFPSPAFYQAASPGGEKRADAGATANLLYVGRLHPEKRSMDLIDMMGSLGEKGIAAHLNIAGEGPDRERMETHAQVLGIGDRVTFLGSVPNEALVELYREADVFVSTVTGTALREAGLIGVAVVAYDMDWVKMLLKDGETALMAAAGDAGALSEKVAAALSDPALRKRIASAFFEEAHRRWPRSNIRKGLEQAFGGADLPQENCARQERLT